MNDLISRQNALDALKEYEVVESDNFTKTDPISKMTVATIANCIEVIWEMPSAELEREKGKWIKDETGYDFWTCSVCGFVSEAFCADILYNYCPNCGVNMRGE